MVLVNDCQFWRFISKKSHSSFLFIKAILVNDEGRMISFANSSVGRIQNGGKPVKFRPYFLIVKFIEYADIDKILGMSELSDGERKKSFERNYGANSTRGLEASVLPGSNVNENASSLQTKMVESSQKSSAATADVKPRTKPPDKELERKVDPRDRIPPKYNNGIKSGPVRRREDDRRPSPSKTYRRPELKSPASGSYRRDSESKRPGTTGSRLALFGGSGCSCDMLKPKSFFSL